jgi:hypothetical protein
LSSEIVVGARRVLLFISTLVIGVILDYAITPESLGPRGFRMGVLALFGLPLFAWLFTHLIYHYRHGETPGGKAAQIGLAAFSGVLLVLYVAATMAGGAA